MRGAVSFEYALILVALVGLFAVLANFYLTTFMGFQYDVKRAYEMKNALLSLESAGYFVRYWDEANLSLTIIVPGGGEVRLYPLRGELNTIEDYNTCSTPCTFTVRGNPFTEGGTVKGVTKILLWKRGAEVGIG